MQAITQTQYGGPDRLQLMDIAKPVPKESAHDLEQRQIKGNVAITI